MHFQWGGTLSLVTLAFDLEIQTRQSEGPNMYVNLAHVFCGSRDISHTKSQTVPKTEHYTVYLMQ